MKQFISILFLFCFTQFVFSQKEDNELHWGYDFINYTVEDGLPSNETYSMVQDDDGYLWISTDNGVSRYDGYEFKNYTIEDGLIDNTIFKMFKDEKGRIWMPGSNGKLCYYEKGSFFPYKYNSILDSVYETKAIRRLIQEIYFINDNLFLKCKVGFLVLDSLGKIVNIVKEENSNISQFEEFILPNNKKVYIRTTTGGDDVLINIRNYSNDLLVGKESTNSYIYRLNINQFNFREKEFLIVGNRILLEDSLVTVFKYFLGNAFVCKNDFVWIPSEKGLLVFENGVEDKYKLIFDKDKFSQIYQDNNGGYWLLSTTNGLYYLPNIFIKSLYKSNKKIGGVFPFSFFYTNSSFFYSKRMEKLYKIKKNSIKEVVLEIIVDSLINNSHSYDISTDKVNIIKNDKSEECDIRFLSKKDSIFFTNCKFLFNVGKTNSIYTMHSNVLLLGTFKGLFLTKDSIMKKIDLGINNSIRVQAIQTLGEDTFIGTRGQGVIIKSQDSLIIISKEKGLLSNSVNNFFKHNNKIWVATTKGLNSIKKQTNGEYFVKKEINQFQGLNNDKIRQLRIKDDYAFLGTDNGLYKVDLKGLKKKQLYNSLVLIKDVLIGNNVKKKEEEFEYTDNDVSILYEAISFVFQGEILYRYKMKNLFDEWQYTKEKKLTFFKLLPNKYQFKIQYQLPSKDWSTPTYYEFKINKPFWNTWWFKILAMLIVASIFLFLFFDFKKRKQLELDFFKSSQTALASQMNPHFVFNAMNSLQNYMLKNENELAQKYLVKFSRLIRIVFENSKENFIPLHKELDALKLYLELEQKRFNNKFAFTVNSNLENNVFVSPLIIQPFVENAVWHGIMHIEDNGKINVDIEQLNNKIIISISDNGLGIEKSKLLKDKSILKTKDSSGILNSKKRILLIEQQYGIKLNFEISQYCKNCKNVGTIVKFELPLFLKNPQE